MPHKHFVYKTTCIINNREYIGIHSTLDIDDGYLGSGAELIVAIKEYGKENFKRDIVKRCRSRAECYKYEAFFVDEEYIIRDDTFNTEIGGDGPYTLRIEHRNAIAKAIANKAKLHED